MIRDFRMEFSQKNKKNDSKKNESKVFSQKFGIKVKPFGITKNEDENKGKRIKNYSNGEKYINQFINDKKGREGIFYYNNGDKYIGIFKYKKDWKKNILLLGY